MAEKQLQEFYKKYIDIKIYRVVSEEYLLTIKREGINPKKDPLREKYKEINKLFKIIKKLENKGIIYYETWRDRKRKGSEIIKINLKSMKKNYIDFVADYKQAIKFKNKWKGGALVNSIGNYINFLEKQNLNSQDEEVVKKLKNWVDKKRKYNNKIIYVKGSERIFENAKMLLLPLDGKITNVKSPYGSYKNFIKTTKNKFQLYEKYLKQEELSYLRVTNKIPKESIFILQ